MARRLPTAQPPIFEEEVELQGHIIDSLLLPKVLDEILTRGGSYVLKDIRIGQRQTDPSYARIEVRAASADGPAGDPRRHPRPRRRAGRRRRIAASCRPTWTAPFPKASTARPTTAPRSASAANGSRSKTRRWTAASWSIRKGAPARCMPMADVRKGDRIVVGRQGLRVFPAETPARQNLFEFMASPVSSEKPKGVTVREIAAAMRRTRAAGEKILAVLGPAVVHTGSVEHICRLIRSGYLNVLFAGNALATHDIEQALYGTSLGVSLDRGLPAEEGHEHHLRAINTIRRLGGIRAAVDTGRPQERHHVRVRPARHPVRPGRQHPRRRPAAGGHHRRARGPAADARADPRRRLLPDDRDRCCTRSPPATCCRPGSRSPASTSTRRP